MLVQFRNIEEINKDLDHVVIHDIMKNLQHELNFKIGQNIKKTEYHTTYWLFNFLQALSDELVEAKDCINWKWWSKEGKSHNPYTNFIDIDNLKIEIIDAMHFLLCLEFLTNFKFTQFQYVDICNNNINDSGFKLVENINESDNPVWDCFVYLDYISGRLNGIKAFCRYESVPFKDFINGIELTDDCRKALNRFLCDSWDILYTICAKFLGLTIQDIYDIYVLKNEANLKRQDEDYSILNKTEEDNNKIKQQIHKDN